MKKWVVIGIIIVLLSIAVFQHFKIKRYEEAITHTYELNVNWASIIGKQDAIRHIGRAIDSINEESRLIHSLANAVTSFKVAEASYAFMSYYIDLETRNISPSFNNYMGWFYRDMTNYIYDLVLDIQDEKIDSQRLIKELTQLREALEFINENMTQELLRKETINEINLTWQTTIEKILLDYPEHPAFKPHRKKYYRNL